MANEDEELEEVEAVESVETTPEPTEEVDWKAKFEEEEGRRKRAETKLNKKPTESKEPTKSDDLDLGTKSFLIANGIKGSKEHEFFQTELKKAPGETVESLIENEYFKGKLDKFRALEQTASATPTGDNRSGGAAIDNVEYWMTKPFEEVPKDMRQAVVNAKLEKETKKGVFYNS